MTLNENRRNQMNLVWMWVIYAITLLAVSGLLVWLVYKHYDIFDIVLCVALMLLAIYVGLGPLTTIKEHIRKLEAVALNHNLNEVKPFSKMTNGLYHVFDVRRGYMGDWLAIIQPTTITKIDSVNRVVEAVDIPESFYLVSIPNPVSFLGSTNYSGFAEIGIENGLRFIRDYHPLKYARELK